MRSFARSPLAVVVGLALVVGPVGGCAARGGKSGSPASPAALTSEQLEPRWVHPGEILADVSQVGAFDTLDKPPVLADQEPQYRALTAGDCQCLAASHSPTANLLEAERRGALVKDCCHGRCTPGCSDQLRAEALALAALDERNRAAAAALKAHYHLIEAHAGKASLASSLKVLDYLLAGLAELKEQGMRAEGIEPGSLERKRLALLEKRTEVELSITQLNAQLRERLGIPPGDPAPFWPEADLTVAIEPIDVEVAVSDGLRQRHDLALVRLLAGRVTDESLAAAEPVLSALHPALGASTPPTLWKLLFPRRAPGQAGTRRKQLRALLADRERAAEAEIRQAAATVAIRIEQIALAKERVLSWTARVAQIESQQASAGGSRRFERGAAKLEQHQAESDLLHQVIAWKLAEVELRAAQGLLATECGHGACP